MKKFIPIPIVFSCVALFVVFTSLFLNNTSFASTTPQISAGGNHSLGLKSDGAVWAWGNNDTAQLGDGTVNQRYTPVQVKNLNLGQTTVSTPTPTVTASLTPSPSPTPTPTSEVTPKILGGYHFSIALKSDGTVWVWGNNISGVLGNGIYTDSTDPVQISELNNVTDIASGLSHCLALKSDGTVWAWGNNSRGELGDGTYSNTTTPIQIGGLSNVTAIAAGYTHSLALKSDGTVWTWGSNTTGQLGDGTNTDSNVPVQVSGLSNVIAISVGVGGNYGSGYSGHSLALKSDGTVWAWGANWSGQLGDGTNTDRNTPVQVSGLNDVTAIAGAGGRDTEVLGDTYTQGHSFAMKSDGTVWAWGNNESGQLGDGSNTDRNAPVQVRGLANVITIAGGEWDHSLALKSDGTVWAWGNNSNGELGIGTYYNRNTPARVSNLSDVIAIGGGYDHSFALKSDGSVWAWGSNSQGELGDGTTTERTTPVQANINLYKTLIPTPSSTPTPTPSPSPTPAEGTGVIYGFVLDENEFAFKNVLVTLAYTNGYSKSAKTDSEGYYEFANLAAGDYTLTYSKDGYQTQTQEVSLEEDESLDLGTITMEPVEKGMISGYVVDIKGDPIEYVKLKLKSIKAKKTKTAVSDADGFFEFTDLDADDYIITAKRSRYKSTRKTIQLEEGDEMEIEIEMKKTSRRGVMVLDQ